MTWSNVLFLGIVLTEFLVIIGIGVVFGRLSMRRRMMNTLIEMKQVAEEISPVLGFLGTSPIFTYGTWLAFGNPPRLVRKKLPKCEVCGHWHSAHRPTVTMLVTDDVEAGDIVPIAMSAVCKIKKCKCMINIGDARFTVERHEEPPEG